MRILIARLSALGDTILTLPLLAELQRQLPNAKIGWLVGKQALPVVQSAESIDLIHVWDRKQSFFKNVFKLYSEIKKEKYDISIDAQGLTKSAIIPFLTRIPKRIGFARKKLDARELSPALNNICVNVPDKPAHVTSRMLSLIKVLELTPPLITPVKWKLNNDDVQYIEKWLSQHGFAKPFITISIGAGWKTKMWENMNELKLMTAAIHESEFKTLLLWGPDEREDVKIWSGKLNVTQAPQTSVSQLLALQSLSAAHIGPDTATLHAAWLLNKPTFSWFGASDPERCAPFGDGHFVIKMLPHNWDRKSDSHAGLASLTWQAISDNFYKWLKLIHIHQPQKADYA